ncbi:iron ABC transporter permease [Paenibacillaceae bacterium]|nr:iron ABC transporter permease [Paenibacillaceae bacterium]
MSNIVPSTAVGRRTVLLPTFSLLVLLVVISVFGMKLGTPTLTWTRLANVLFTNAGEEIERIVVLEIRLPRFVLGLLVGSLLGSAGTLMQGALNNRLAGPELLGVSAGASLFMAAITVLHLPISFRLHPLLALAGGLAGGLFVVLSARGSKGTASMLLIGMSVTAILNGLMIILIAMGTSNDVNMLYTYLLGSLANRSWDHVLHILPWFALAFPAALLFSRALNVLQLGDEAASGLGLKVERIRISMLIVCTALVSITVAQCGPIGYISLLAPHLTRLLARSIDARLVLPISALCGAGILTTADLLSRLLLYPMEIPVGIWTTLVGGTVFLLFFLQRKGGNG